MSLQIQLASAKGELREGCDIAVHDAHRDTVKSVAKMSSGERNGSTTTSRAMALYLAQAGSRRGATLLSDEAGGAFDAQHKRRFMAMKREVLRLGGYAQDYFISHTPELADIADAVIDPERYAAARMDRGKVGEPLSATLGACETCTTRHAVTRGCRTRPATPASLSG